MGYRRILTIQDISCVGQCSMTVALPVLSACGHETCILPTAMLSTHTGGFGKPVVLHFDQTLRQIMAHWQENGITFDAILVGYLGSIPAVETAMEIMAKMLAPGGVSIVDPAMADHGRLYSGFDETYAAQMGELCRRADVILPNLTEAAMLSGHPFRLEMEDYVEESYVKNLLQQLGHSRVVLTGTCWEQGRTGVTVWDGKSLTKYSHDRIGKSYHGTGDLFAAAFAGAWIQGKTMEEAVKIAADFVRSSISCTERNPAHWYGVKFEEALPGLIAALAE